MRILLLIAVFSLLADNSFSQISQDGRPLELLRLKSNSIPVVDMPAVNNAELRMQEEKGTALSPKLKPFRFAHSFDVELSPENSGIWLASENGYAVWLLKIRSKNAKSLNLIFDEFKLPGGARLFLYNENKSHVLGAYTALNNKQSGKFAVSPVAGDVITIQYEVPEKIKNRSNFRIVRVNHDYVGILKYDERRPLDKTAGECNVDVNCSVAEDWSDVKDAVCRLIVNGREICTGTLINNTAEDQKPYIISAAHCYDEWQYAETTVYTFNYESPYCAPLDGDPSQSISGAILKAKYDSLDFALAELSLVPPPEYHSFYAGWDRSGNIPDSTTTIHHPQGDIKKISFDSDPPSYSDFNGNYISNAFLKVARWDAGVTEAGSSGGPLFNHDQNLVGTLTGGVATCANPVRDYFERIELSWDYKTDSTKQLKHWLDPLNSGAYKLNGKRFDISENLCGSFTNLTDDDHHFNVPVTNFGEFSGYWGGSNNVGITEFMERFSIAGNEVISGVSFGVGKIHDAPAGPESEITIKIYNGGNKPEELIYSQKAKINYMAQDAMNFFGFPQPVQTADTFYVGFELSNIQSLDSFVVYQSLRMPERANHFFFKQDGEWHNFKSANLDDYSMTNVIEVLACNVNGNVTDSPLVNNTLEIMVYPNPTNSFFTLETGKKIELENISVFNITGQQVEVNYSKLEEKKVDIDLSGNVPGIYFVRFNNGKGFATKKISYVPW